MSMTLYTVFARLDVRWIHADTDDVSAGHNAGSSAYDVKVPVYLSSGEAPTKPAFRALLTDEVARWKHTGMPGVVLAQIYDEQDGDVLGTFQVESLADIYRHAEGFKRAACGTATESSHALHDDHTVLVFDATVDTDIFLTERDNLTPVTTVTNALAVEIPLSLHGAACFEEKMAFMLPRFDQNRPHPLRAQFLNPSMPTRFLITKVEDVRNLRPAAHQPYSSLTEGVLNILRRRGPLTVHTASVASPDVVSSDTPIAKAFAPCMATMDFHYRAEGMVETRIERATVATQYEIGRTHAAYEATHRAEGSRDTLLSYFEQGLDWRPVVRRGSDQGPRWQLIDAALVHLDAQTAP